MKLNRSIRYFGELFSASLGCGFLIFAISGNYWFDILGADLTDQGFGTNLSLHGGLFQSCGPALDSTSGKIEDCFKYEEVIGSGIPRCLIIGRSLLITSVLCIAYSVLCRIIHPKIETVNELYLLALGLIFISFSMAASIIVSIGLLVCNCLDELGLDGWLSLVGIFSLIVAFILSPMSTKYSDSSNISRLIYLFLTFTSFIATVAMLFTDWYNSKNYVTNSSSGNQPGPGPIFPQFIECEKRFTLWEYCLGFCQNDEFRWECAQWENYLEMSGGINTLNWKTPIPFSINVSRVWITALFLGLFLQHFALYSRSKFSRIIILTNVLTSFGLGLTMYTFNYLESRSYGILNTTNSSTAMVLSMVVLFMQNIIYCVDTILVYATESNQKTQL